MTQDQANLCGSGNDSNGTRVTVLEVARVSVEPDTAREFELAFGRAIRYVRDAEGHVESHLMRDVDTPGRYLFLVRWQRLSDHVETFVQSAGFALFDEIVRPFLTSGADVTHFETVVETT